MTSRRVLISILCATMRHLVSATWVQEIGHFLQSYLGSQFGVVIGVGPDARFAQDMLEAWPQGVLFLCDPFIHIAKGYDHPTNVDDKTHQHNFERLRTTMDVPGRRGRYSIVREFSFSFVRLWKEGKIENMGRSPAFVYLDANLAPEAITQDLNDWYPMVSSPGVLGGSNWTQVEPVVHAFFSKLQVEVYVGDGLDPSWMVVKDAHLLQKLR